MVNGIDIRYGTYARLVLQNCMVIRELQTEN